MDFKTLWLQCWWKPIWGCKGRFILKQGELDIATWEGLRVYHVQNLDPVYIVTFKRGGLISYRKPDGRFVHTLNTASGFKKKLIMMGLCNENPAHFD